MRRKTLIVGLEGGTTNEPRGDKEKRREKKYDDWFQEETEECKDPPNGYPMKLNICHITEVIYDSLLITTIWYEYEELDDDKPRREKY